jgi:hypothetical protein
MIRIYHPWNKWECFKSGFYADSFKNYNIEECKIMYRDFLGNLNLFEKALKKVISKWKHSCEHFLSNKSINRIAWLGQASACMWYGLPSKYKSGFNLLSKNKQNLANRLARRYLKIWEKDYENIYANGKIRAIQMEFRMKFQ